MLRNKDLYIKLWQLFSKENQMMIAIEEMSELQKEISKYYRGDGDLDHIAEEIADVKIMLEQLITNFDLEAKVNEWKEKKIERIKELVGDDEKKPKETNLEHYKDELIAIVEEGDSIAVDFYGNVQKCISIKCNNCLLHDRKGTCTAERIKWMSEEYKGVENDN